MKKTQQLFLGISLLFFGAITAQSGQFNGNWALCKIVTAQGDTQIVSINDARYITYAFTYNNTFTSFRKEKNEEASGRWGYEFKTKTIKIKMPIYIKSKEPINDYDIKIHSVTQTNFVEIKEEKKKPAVYYIYCKTK